MKSRENNKRKPTERAKAKTPILLDAAEIARSPQFTKAYKAIAKHQTGMWAGQDLSGAFAVRACWAVLPIPLSRKWLENVWLRGTGKSWKALKEYPGRLKRMADEIESLNARFLAIPEGCENPTLVNFSQLPVNLRAYAETLGNRTSRIPKTFRPPSRSRRLVELLNFAGWVADAHRDREVADLLSAAAEAMGYDEIFDATQLAQARNRYHGPSENMLL